MHNRHALQSALFFLFLIVLLALGTACGSDDSTDGDNPDGDNPDGDNPDGDNPDGDNPDGDNPDGDEPDGDEPDGDDPDGDDPDGDDPDGDTPDGDDPSCDGVRVTSLSGLVVDENDDPLVDVSVFACIIGPDNQGACLRPVFTDDNGRYQVLVPEAQQCLQHSAIRFLPVELTGRISLSCPIDLGSGGNVDTSTAFKLPAVPESLRDPLDDPATEHAMHLSGDSMLTVIPEDLTPLEGGYADINLMEWDADAWGWPCFIDPADPPAQLFTVAPEVEVHDPDAVHVWIENTTGLAAGSDVLIYGLGSVATYTWDDEPVMEGEWALIQNAEVASSGQGIETATGAGLPFLTWFGWKAAD